jgi:hypothetical protein
LSVYVYISGLNIRFNKVSFFGICKVCAYAPPAQGMKLQVKAQSLPLEHPAIRCSRGNKSNIMCPTLQGGFQQITPEGIRMTWGFVCEMGDKDYVYIQLELWMVDLVGVT